MSTGLNPMESYASDEFRTKVSLKQTDSFERHAGADPKQCVERHGYALSMAFTPRASGFSKKSVRWLPDPRLIQTIQHLALPWR